MVDTSRGHWTRSLAGEHGIGLGRLLFAFLGAPVSWSLHFLAIYFLVALACTTGWAGAEPVIWITTALFAFVSAAAGWVAYRAWRARGESDRWDRAVVATRGRITFMLLVGMLGAGLFTVLIVVETLPLLFVPTCPEIVP